MLMYMIQVLQGSIDAVVPPEQAEIIVWKQTRCAAALHSAEAHGFHECASDVGNSYVEGWSIARTLIEQGVILYVRWFCYLSQPHV